MSHSTTFLNPDGNSPNGDGFSPSRRVGIKHRLFQKLALKGYTMRSFARHYGLCEPDLSNYFNGKRKRVGRKTKQKIRQALIVEGILNPPKPQPKTPCPTCGRLMRVHALRTSNNIEEWLQKAVSR